MKKKTENAILVSGLRTTLKSIMEQEIERMPELLEQLEAKDRLSITLKMMPYLFPKVQTVNLTEGEPKKHAFDMDIVL